MKRLAILSVVLMGVLVGCGFSTSSEPEIVSTNVRQDVPTATADPNQPAQTEEPTNGENPIAT